MRYAENPSGRHDPYQWSFSLMIDSQADVWVTSCFADVTVISKAGRTRISGSAEDISAIYGLLMGLRDMGTSIVYLEVKREIDDIDNRPD